MRDEIKSPLPPDYLKGFDRSQNNELKISSMHFRHLGNKVTEEHDYNNELLKVSVEYPQIKAWWDWLQLLIIPLLIVGLGIGFTWVQNQTSLQIAKDNRAQDLQIAKDTQQEATLKTYLDDMTTLLLDKKLGSQAPVDKATSAEAAVIARAQTLTSLRALETNRKGALLRFLYETHLILNSTPQSAGPIISLVDANLSGAHLRDADLRNANLSGANLSGADLRNTKLGGTDLRGAILDDTDLRGAEVSTEQLMQAKSLKGTVMPNGLRYS